MTDQSTDVWGFWTDQIENAKLRKSLESIIQGSRVWLEINVHNVVFQLSKLNNANKTCFFEAIGSTGSIWAIVTLSGADINICFPGFTESTRLLDGEIWVLPTHWDWWPLCIPLLDDDKKTTLEDP